MKQYRSNGMGKHRKWRSNGYDVDDNRDRYRASMDMRMARE